MRIESSPKSKARVNVGPYSSYLNRRFTNEDFRCGWTGVIGRPLIAELLAKGHALVALTRSPEGAQSFPLRQQSKAILGFI
jgi:hypothetical protein